jgi:hypothetical protein
MGWQGRVAFAHWGGLSPFMDGLIAELNQLTTPATDEP